MGCFIIANAPISAIFNPDFLRGNSSFSFFNKTIDFLPYQNLFLKLSTSYRFFSRVSSQYLYGLSNNPSNFTLRILLAASSIRFSLTFLPELIHQMSYVSTRFHIHIRTCLNCNFCSLFTVFA
jgi:hypothetical protein